MINVLFPEMRRELIDRVALITDKEYQQKYWGTDTPCWGFDYIVHCLFDDSPLAEQPYDCIGKILADESEAAFTDKICRLISLILDKYGRDKDDKYYCNTYEWDELIAEAQKFLHYIKTIDKDVEIDSFIGTPIIYIYDLKHGAIGAFVQNGTMPLIVGNFAIYFDGKTLIKNENFPVMEFASKAATWLRADKGDFVFNSETNSDVGSICFIRQDENLFKLQAEKQISVIDRLVEYVNLRNSLVVMFNNTVAYCKYDLKIDVSTYLNRI